MVLPALSKSRSSETPMRTAVGASTSSRQSACEPSANTAERRRHRRPGLSDTEGVSREAPRPDEPEWNRARRKLNPARPGVRRSRSRSTRRPAASAPGRLQATVTGGHVLSLMIVAASTRVFDKNQAVGIHGAPARAAGKRTDLARLTGTTGRQRLVASCIRCAGARETMSRKRRVASHRVPSRTRALSHPARCWRCSARPAITRWPGRPRPRASAPWARRAELRIP